MKNLTKKIFAMLFISVLAGCGGGGGAGEGLSSPEGGGSLNLSLGWSAPSTRVDGEPLAAEDIAGYKIYYGTASNEYTTAIDVGNTSTYTISNLSSGTYYVTVTAYDVAGNESAHSTEISGAI